MFIEFLCFQQGLFLWAWLSGWTKGTALVFMRLEPQFLCRFRQVKFQLSACLNFAMSIANLSKNRRLLILKYHVKKSDDQ